MRLIGASYPGTRRRYEFVVGAANARIAGACFSRPPIYQRQSSLMPAYPALSANSGTPSFHRLWWVCMPDPLSMNRGFGMKVATNPFWAQTFLTTYLYIMTWSAIFTRVP